MTQTINELTSFFVTQGYNDQSKIKASTGFLSRWGKGAGSITVRVNDRLDFSMDIVRNKKKIGQLLPRSQATPMQNIGGNSKTKTGQNFQNVARNFPIIQSFANVSHDEVMRYRMPNQLAIKDTQRSDAGLITEAGIRLGMHVNENMKETVGRMELMAAEALRTGQITLDDGVTVYDFGRSATNTNTLGTLWSNVAADGFNDLSVHYKNVQRNGKGNPNFIVMAGDSFNAFLNLTLVKASADNREISFIRAGNATMPLPRVEAIADMEENGFTYQAYFKDPATGRQMYIFVYDEEYQNAADTWISYMPSGKVLFFDPDMRLDRFFGPRIRFDYETPEERLVKRLLGVNGMVALPELTGRPVEPWMFHHDVVFNKDKTSFGIESYTGPLFAPTEVDSAGELTVL
jgi:hypothetical protein